MLVRITQHCTMQCSHCMVDATPEGKHMLPGVFADTIEFIIHHGLSFILMSGGEPTDHPDVVAYIKYAASRGVYTMLLSNGEWLHEKSELRDKILPLVHAVQVTNDPRFYPRKVEPYAHPKVTFETELQQVTPQGRAVTNKIPAYKRAPECFNIRSLTRYYGSFMMARMALVAQGKMCTPSVNIDGSISAGESPFCHKIGNVTDPTEVLDENLRKMRCSRCGLVNNLDHKHKRAIGEASIILPGEE